MHTLKITYFSLGVLFVVTLFLSLLTIIITTRMTRVDVRATPIKEATAVTAASKNEVSGVIKGEMIDCTKHMCGRP